MKLHIRVACLLTTQSFLATENLIQAAKEPSPVEFLYLSELELTYLSSLPFKTTMTP